MGVGLLIGCLIAILVYTMVPNYIIRNTSKKVARRLEDSGRIALTFDDGPDPSYTGQVLDILSKHQIKATFFLVAKEAQKHPELIHRMLNEGHEIGLHAFTHKSEWFMLPYETYKSMKLGQKLLKGFDENLIWYRPPWGTFNLFTYPSANRLGLKTVLWSVEAYDWRNDTTSAKIETIVLGKTSGGDVIVLHDARGAKGAPGRMVDALDGICEVLKQSYEFVTLKEGLL